MQEVCNFFSIVRESDAAQSGGYRVVENCSKFDAALTGFFVVVFEEELGKVYDFVEDRFSNLFDYFKENVESGQGSFAFDLLRDTIHLTSFTEEFVTNAGSVQNFLDLYGRGSSVIEFADMGENEFPSEQVELESFAPVGEMRGIQNDEESDETQYFRNEAWQQETIEEPPTWQPEQETIEESPIWQPEQEPIKEPPTWQPEPEPTEEQSAWQPEQESVVEQPKPVTLQKLKRTESEPESKSECVTASIAYPIECNGVDIEGATFQDGKIIVKFEELSKFVNSIVAVASSLENKDAINRRTLTIEDLEIAAAEVDKYSPSVVKEFLISYVLHANQDLDLVRVTALLDDFCTYISERKIACY